MSTHDNPPAFPRPAYAGGYESGTPFPHHEQDGMGLRDYFAAAALKGLLATDDEPDDAELNGQSIQQYLAEVSYEYADAMLVARKERA